MLRQKQTSSSSPSSEPRDTDGRTDGRTSPSGHFRDYTDPSAGYRLYNAVYRIHATDLKEQSVISAGLWPAPLVSQ